MEIQVSGSMNFIWGLSDIVSEYIGWCTTEHVHCTIRTCSNMYADGVQPYIVVLVIHKYVPTQYVVQYSTVLECEDFIFQNSTCHYFCISDIPRICNEREWYQFLRRVVGISVSFFVSWKILEAIKGIAYAAAFDASQRNTISDSPMGEISNQIQRDAIVIRKGKSRFLVFDSLILS